MFGITGSSLRNGLDQNRSVPHFVILGSTQEPGGPPGLQIQCGVVNTPWVGSIPMCSRQQAIRVFSTSVPAWDLCPSDAGRTLSPDAFSALPSAPHAVFP